VTLPKIDYCFVSNLKKADIFTLVLMPALESVTLYFYDRLNEVYVLFKQAVEVIVE